MQIHFTPDSNVRTAPPGWRRDPRVSRARGLARSLLTLSMEPSFFVLFALVSSMSACVIPVAPNFQDPPSAPNAPPSILNPSPIRNSVVTVPVPAGLTFSANVTDQNVGDFLYYRWAVDYPPFTSSTRQVPYQKISPRSDGEPINQPVSLQVDCILINSTPSSDGKHRLELIVADRLFSTSPALTADNLLDSIDDPTGFVVPATWTVVISCPATAAPPPGSP